MCDSVKYTVRLVDREVSDTTVPCSVLRELHSMGLLYSTGTICYEMTERGNIMRPKVCSDITSNLVGHMKLLSNGKCYEVYKNTDHVVCKKVTDRLVSELIKINLIEIYGNRDVTCWGTVVDIYNREQSLLDNVCVFLEHCTDVSVHNILLNSTVIYKGQKMFLMEIIHYFKLEKYNALVVR